MTGRAAIAASAGQVQANKANSRGEAECELTFYRTKTFSDPGGVQ